MGPIHSKGHASQEVETALPTRRRAGGQRTVRVRTP